MTGHAKTELGGKQQELQDVRGRIAQLKDEVEQASEDRKEAADSLRDSEQRISQVNLLLRELQRDERKLLGHLQTLDLDRERLQTQLKEQETRLAALLRQRHVQGAADSARILLSGRNPADIQRDLEYFTYLGHARTALIRDHRRTLDRLAAVQEEIKQKHSGLQSIKQGRLIQRKTLASEKQAREAVLAKLSDQIRRQRSEITTLVRDEARLARLIERLRKLASAPKPAPKKPKTGKTKETQVVTTVADASLAGVQFASLRGKLALPVEGEILGRFGQPREGGGPIWKGLFIRTAAGKEVRSVASGEVVFADWLRGFGNLLIVDHGQGFLSLYSNNESLYKHPGDAVRAGDVVAAVGNTGGQESPGLYFELRRQGQPFDPLTWVK